MTQSLKTAVLSLSCVAFVGIATAQQQPNQANPTQRPQNAQPAGPQTDQPRQDTMSRTGSQSDPMEQQLREIASDPKTASEKLFVIGCSQESLFAVEVAKQAEQKAQNVQVKQLARQIVQDHQQSRQQLEAVARQLNLEIPQRLSPMHQQFLEIIGSTPSDQYDKWFTLMTQAHHSSALIANRGVAQISQNAQVREYAQKQAAMLSKHYDQAQAAALALGLPSGGPDAIPAAGRLDGVNRPTGGVIPNPNPNPNTPRP